MEKTMGYILIAIPRKRDPRRRTSELEFEKRKAYS